MNRHWMPLYIADYLKDTSNLRALESGAYLHLIMSYWLSGRLPNDDRQLATIAKMTDGEWKRAKPVLSTYFGPEWASHKRIDKEITHAEEISGKRKAAVEQREINRRSRDASIDRSSDDTVHTSPSPSKESKKDIRAVSKETRPPDSNFLRFWKAYPKRKGANPKAAAEKLFLSAVRAGADPEKIIAAAAARIGFDADKIGTEFIPQAVKWLRDRRWEDDSGAESSEPNPEHKAAAERLGWTLIDGKWVKPEAA